MIETERLILRGYTASDFDALHEIISDAETMRYYTAPYDEAGTKRWLAWCMNSYAEYGFGLWAAVLRQTGEFIGDCGLSLQNIDGETLPEIGYHINKKFWHQGYAKEAARAVRDWAFKNTAYGALYSYMNSANTASRRTALANGMKQIKEYRDKNGTEHCVYAITRTEWEGIV